MNIGQRVRCISDGLIGRILAAGQGQYLVEFENWHGGHNGNNVDSIIIPNSNSCWWISEGLEVLNFYPGDIVYTWALPEVIRRGIDDSIRLTDTMCEHLYAGVVLQISEDANASTLVEFDGNFVNGHSGSTARGRENGCRWVNSGELRLYKERRTFVEMSALPQDRILVNKDYNNNVVAGRIGVATGNHFEGKVEAMFEGTTTLFHIPREKACLIASTTALDVYKREIEENVEMPYVTREVIHDEEGVEVNVIYEPVKEAKKKEKKIRCSLCTQEYPEDGSVFGSEDRAIEKKKEIENLLGKKLEHVCYYCANKFRKCHECGKLLDLREGERYIGAVWIIDDGENVLLCQKCKKDLEDEIVRCSSCGEFVFGDSATWEDEEPYCQGCYNARESQETDIYDYQRVKYKELPFTTFTQLPQRNYGVEIETHCEENYSLAKDDIRPWLRYEDGSLGYDGEEFASPIFAGDAGLREIEKLLVMLKENKYYVNSDCAVHCHVDAKDYKFRDVRRFLLFMHDFEPIIYSFLRRPCSGGVPRLKELIGRDNLRRVSGWKKLKQALYGRTANISDHSKWGDIRYRGLNVHSYFFRKTFEFRYLGKTMYTNEICNFARFAVFTVENGRFYKTTKKIIKPTLKEMAHILQFPKDLHEYLVESQKKYDENRHIIRKEEERV